MAAIRTIPLIAHISPQNKCGAPRTRIGQKIDTYYYAPDNFSSGIQKDKRVITRERQENIIRDNFVSEKCKFPDSTAYFVISLQDIRLTHQNLNINYYVSRRKMS